jgi:diguanylate cyclase (GGDEF)-like protein
VHAVLARSHPLATVERAVLAAVSGAPGSLPPPPVFGDLPPTAVSSDRSRRGPFADEKRVVPVDIPSRSMPPPPPFDSGLAPPDTTPPNRKVRPPLPDYLDPLHVAERLSDHPLVEELAQLRILEGIPTDDALHRLAGDTAHVFETAMALVWLDSGTESGFATYPPLDRAALADDGGAWAGLRNALAAAPLYVADAATHRLLMRNPLVAAGTVRCLAGAPLRGPDGKLAGAICLAHPLAGGIPPDKLDPLIFWAYRVGSELPAPLPSSAESRPPSRPPPGNGDPVADGTRAAIRAARSAKMERAASAEAADARRILAALQTGICVTAPDGIISFANQRMSALVGLGAQRVAGMARDEILSRLAEVTEDAGLALATLTQAAQSRDPQAVHLTMLLPHRRVLRWQTRPLGLGSGQGRLDEITDVTADAAEMDGRDKLVRIDALTELLNRRGGEEALGREISLSLRTGAPLSLGLFTVDGLDQFEARVAERVFKAVAWILRDTLRGYDLVSRFADDKLMALLPSVTASQMGTIAERFRASVEQTAIEGMPRVTISGGVAQLDASKDVQHLLAEGEAALTEALRAGGNVVL